MVLLAFMAFFFRVLFFGEVFFFRDHYQEYYPLKRLALDMLAEGHLPVWNPRSMMGQPLLANPNWTLLYPGNLLLLTGDFPRSYSITFALHVLIAMVGFYYFCRVLGRSPPAAACGSLLYCCGGFFLSQGSFMPFLLTMCWQPVVLAELLRNLRDHTPRRRWALVGAVSMMVFAGEPVTILFTAALASVLAWQDTVPATRPRELLRAWMKEPRWLAFLLLGVAVFPRVLFFLSSGRTAGLSFEMVSDFPLDPKMLITAIVPNAFGDIHEYVPWRLFGAALTGHRFPYLLSIYIGAPCLLLAAARLCRRPLPLPGMILSALTLVLAVGTTTPLFYLFYASCPFAGSLRFPIKFVFFAVFFLAVWAAEGFDLVRGAGWRSLPGPVCASGLVLAAMGAGWLAFSPTGIATTHAAASVVAHTVSAFIRHQILLGGGVTIAAFLAIILLSRGRPAALFVVAFADLFVANTGLNPTVTRDFYAPQALAQRLANASGRVMVLGPFRSVIGTTPPTYRSYSHYLNAGGRATLYALSAVDSGVSYGFDPSIDRSFTPMQQAFIDELEGKTFAQAKPLFDLSGIRWFISPEPLSAPGLELRATEEPVPFAKIHVYENTAVMSRVWLSNLPVRVEPLSRHPEILLSGFDPRTGLLLDHPPQSSPGGAGSIQGVEILVETPVRLAVRTRTGAPAILVCADTYHPDWTARLDGHAVSILVANGAFRAVEVPAGTHLVEFRCRLWPHILSLIAVAALCLLIVLGLLGTKSRAGVTTSAELS